MHRLILGEEKKSCGGFTCSLQTANATHRNPFQFCIQLSCCWNACVFFWTLFQSSKQMRNCRFSIAKLEFHANISFAFQAIEKLLAHPTNLCFAELCKFLGDFGGYLGG